MKRLILLAAGLQGLVGCVTEGVICTESAVTSVTVDVKDAYGSPIAGATATYAEEGGSPVACEDLGGGTFACGTEVAGHLAIHVEAPGYEDFDKVLPVQEDECHVIPETLDVVLEGGEPPCEGAEEEDDVSLSMHVAVVGADGEELHGVRVFYGPMYTDEPPRECEMAGPTDAYCGWGEVGDFYVLAMAFEHVRTWVEVTVEADECGEAIPEEVLVELAWKDMPDDDGDWDEEEPPR
jgi:hypothetical protein